MKKDSYVIIFYFLYFSWLFFITYLTAKVDILNYFTFSVVAFYFLFLREGSDFFWFFLASTGYLLFSTISYTGSQLTLDTAKLVLTPVWIPLAWGTTIIALRKFYIVVTR